MQCRHERDMKPNPNRSCLVFWNGTVHSIEQLLVLVLNRLSSNVAFGGGTWESATFDNDDVFRGCDALVDIATRMKLPRSPDNFLLELLVLHCAFFRSLDEQSGRRSPVANDNALENEFTAGGAEVVLDRSELVNDKRLLMMWTLSGVDSLCVAPETVLTLDPIIFSASRKVLPCFNLEE